MSIMRVVLITFVAFVIQLTLFILAGALSLPEESVGWLVAPGVWLGDWLIQRTGAIDIAQLPYMFGAIGINMILNGLLVSFLIGVCSRPTPADPRS